MQYADHCDAIFGDADVNFVSAYLESPKPRANVIALASNLRLFRQRSKGSGNFIRVVVRLLESPFS